MSRSFLPGHEIFREEITCPQLIDICVSYADKYELSFNVKKTKIICFFAKEY